MPGCIFALVVGFIFIILSFVINVFKMFWTVRKTTRQFMNGDPSSQTNGSGGFFRDKAKSSANGPSSSSTAKERKEEEHRDKNGRFFERDEGEYVDYEEVKD